MKPQPVNPFSPISQPLIPSLEKEEPEQVPLPTLGEGFRVRAQRHFCLGMLSLNWSLGAIVSTIALLALPTAALAQARIHSIENGTVQVRRQDSGVYINGRRDLPLQPRDALLPSQRARVRVDCPNGAQPSVRAGRLSGMNVICPEWARSFDGKDEDDLLLLLAGQVPYVPQVGPDIPTFIWPDVTPGEPYQVTVSQVTFVEVPSADPFAPPTSEAQETVLYETTAMANRWTYDGPTLEAEGRYQLQVATPAGALYQAAFRPLATDEATELAAGVEALTVLNLEPLDEALALAYLYQEAELAWEVITLLQPLVAQGEATATVHHLLGEAYLKTGSYGLAEAHYGAAVTLAEEIEDARTVAAAWVGLAKVAAADQNRELTVQRLATAQQLYTDLAVDEGWVATIDEWLDKIEDSTTNPGT